MVHLNGSLNLPLCLRPIYFVFLLLKWNNCPAYIRPSMALLQWISMIIYMKKLLQKWATIFPRSFVRTFTSAYKDMLYFSIIQKPFLDQTSPSIYCPSSLLSLCKYVLMELLWFLVHIISHFFLNSVQSGLPSPTLALPCNSTASNGKVTVFT